jgi:MFS family permease
MKKLRFAVESLKETWGHVLRERNMKWYLGTQLISIVGFMLRTALLQLLINDVFKNPKQALPLIGWVSAVNMLPGAFGGVIVGIFLDRHDKRFILQVTAMLGFIQALMLTYLTFADFQSITATEIMGIAIFGGLTNAVDGISRNVIIKDALVDKEPTTARTAQTMFTMLYTFGMILGNGLAGWLAISLGYSSCFLLNAISFLVLMFGLGRMDFSHNPPRPDRRDANIGREAKEGLIYTFHHPLIRPLIFISAAITIFGYSYNIILSVIAKEMFVGDPKKVYSVLATMAGIGSLIGSTVSTGLSKNYPREAVIGGSILMGICLILFGFTRDVHIASLLVFLCGFGFMAAFTPPRAAIMSLADGKIAGRVMGVTFMFFYGGIMVSSWVSGYLGKQLGCPAVLVGCGVSLLIIGLRARQSKTLMQLKMH